MAHKIWSRSLLFKDFRLLDWKQPALLCKSTHERSNDRSGAGLKTESETGKRR